MFPQSIVITHLRVVSDTPLPPLHIPAVVLCHLADCLRSSPSFPACIKAPVIVIVQVCFYVWPSACPSTYFWISLGTSWTLDYLDSTRPGLGCDSCTALDITVCWLLTPGLFVLWTNYFIYPLRALLDLCVWFRLHSPDTPVSCLIIRLSSVLFLVFGFILLWTLPCHLDLDSPITSLHLTLFGLLSRFWTLPAFMITDLIPAWISTLFILY